MSKKRLWMDMQLFDIPLGGGFHPGAVHTVGKVREITKGGMFYWKPTREQHSACVVAVYAGSCCRVVCAQLRERWKA